MTQEFKAKKKFRKIGLKREPLLPNSEYPYILTFGNGSQIKMKEVYKGKKGSWEWQQTKK